VQWANEQGETGRHYDLCGQYEGRDVWIEVKTTTQSTSLIPIGLSQLLTGVSEKFKVLISIVIGLFSVIDLFIRN
jgi:hypothetical protein